MEKRKLPRFFSESISREIEKLFEDFFSPFEAKTTFLPHVDVMEDENNVIIKVDVPGMGQKDVSVEIQDDQLVIRGERKEEEELKGKNVYVSERRYGRFVRRITLPDYVEAEKTKAKIKDGVLTVTIPKKEKVKPKQISVEFEE